MLSQTCRHANTSPVYEGDTRTLVFNRHVEEFWFIEYRPKATDMPKY